jgi:hypothetical protein
VLRLLINVWASVAPLVEVQVVVDGPELSPSCGAGTPWI